MAHLLLIIRYKSLCCLSLRNNIIIHTGNNESDHGEGTEFDVD
jgi:hypothetical protein